MFLGIVPARMATARTAHDLIIAGASKQQKRQGSVLFLCLARHWVEERYTKEEFSYAHHTRHGFVLAACRPPIPPLGGSLFSKKTRHGATLSYTRGESLDFSFLALPSTLLLL